MDSARQEGASAAAAADAVPPSAGEGKVIDGHLAPPLAAGRSLRSTLYLCGTSNLNKTS